MRSLIVFVALAAILPVSNVLAQPVLVSVGEADWRFADPSAVLVGGVNVGALTSSKLVRNVLLELVGKMGQNPEVLKAMDQASSVSRISFSLGEGKGEPSVLMLVEGNLDDAAAARMIQGKLEMRRLDLNTVLMGSAADLNQAATRMNATQPVLRASLQRQALALARSNDLWIAGAIPAVGGAKLAIPMESLSLGLNLQTDVLLDLNVNMTTVKAAQDLVKQIQQGKKDELAKIGATLEASVAGTAAKVHFAMNGDQVAKAMGEAWSHGVGQQMSGILGMAGMAAAAANASQAAPTPAPAPTRKNVVIYGLEDGPREIPLTK